MLKYNGLLNLGILFQHPSSRPLAEDPELCAGAGHHGGAPLLGVGLVPHRRQHAALPRGRLPSLRRLGKPFPI